MGYIYKITNLINGKEYIGKTSYSIPQRWKIHLKDYKRETEENRPLYRAMNKYGIDNFVIKEIEECSEKILSERESYWIDYYNTFHNGYNATRGGDGRCLYNHQEILKLLKDTQLDGVEIAKKIGCCVDVVYSIAKANNISLNYENKKGGKNFLKNKKSISQFNRNNIFIQTFDSVADAAKWCYENNKCTTVNSGVRSHIAEVANGKRASAYGYIWKYDK